MKLYASSRDEAKGWSVGAWNSAVPIPIGYANQGINETHYHAVMHEVYLIARGSSTALIDGLQVRLAAGDILVVEPGEVHTFLESSEEYFHFVLQIPFTPGDKHLPDKPQAGSQV